MTDLITMQNMVKIFPPNVTALDHVSVEFRKGEIHSIVGENGAGKSTLMKVLYGLVLPNEGSITFEGEPVRFHNPGEAIARGIGMVHQEILLIPEYTVWENIVLGREPVLTLGRMDRERSRSLVKEKVEEFQFNLDPDALVNDISVAARQKVEILKLLYRNVSVLILDEPTAVLTPQEIPQLFTELHRLGDNGHTILFVSHRLDEVLDLSDRITVMRRGKKIDTVATTSTNKEDLAHMMVGRDVIFTSRREPRQPGKRVFQIEGLNFKSPEGRDLLKNINLEVRAGEIVGIAGVEGNGQFELVNTIMGLSEPASGIISVQGDEITRASILDRRRLVAFVPQDRGRMGAALNASIMENASMTHHLLNPAFTGWKGLLMNFRFAGQFTAELQKLFSVSMSSKDAPFRSLSGGNQQKVILGRELLLPNPFILLDQPTRGLDVGSIEYVHEQILRMRSEDRAVLLISADLEEIFLLSDRILVLYRGAIAGERKTEETSVEEIGLLMLQGQEEPA
jgi:simple sugar transport system ATP-binding protein